jgi:hypothetical protein
MPAESNYQVMAKNYILKGLLSLDDVFLVESGERFRIDFLVKELLSTGNEILGFSIATYVMYRVNWQDVRNTLIEQEKIPANDTTLFEILPSEVYFPVLFITDYCTVDGLRDTCMRIISIINRENFETVRKSHTAEKKP